MKKTALFLSFSFLFVLLSVDPLSAQSDREILKLSKAKLDKKVCDTAFYLVLSIKKVKSKKAQAILKRAYPCLVSKNVRKATKIVLEDNDDNKTKCDKLQQQISIMNESSNADSLFKLHVKEDVYRSLNKKKSINKSLITYSTRLEELIQNIAKQEKLKRINDSIALADSIMTAKALADSIALAEAQLNNDSENNIKQNTNASGGKKYYIIAGYFKTENQAQAEVDKLKAKGFNSEIVNKNNDGNLRICYNSYNNLDEARKDLIEIRKTQRPDAWILEK